MNPTRYPVNLTAPFFIGILLCFSCGTQKNLQRSNAININLKVPWTPTNLQINAGRNLNITASGTLHWFSPAHNNYATTPDGQQCSYQGFAAQGLACWSLIGKIGQNGQPFQVGSNYSGTAATSGELFLGVNDTYYPDNAGSWTATVVISNSCQDPPRVGDVLIYWNNGKISHSGYVTTVSGCKVVGFTCYSIPYGRVLPDLDPDSSIFSGYGTWTVYHTDRPYQRKIKTVYVPGKALPAQTYAPDKVTEGITDKATLIAFYHAFYKLLGDFGPSSINCHGYTFDAMDVDNTKWVGDFGFYPIEGYGIGKITGNIVWHVNQSIVDQGTAVQIILRDNGYHQVQAEGAYDLKSHYDSQFDIANFKNLP